MKSIFASLCLIFFASNALASAYECVGSSCHMMDDEGNDVGKTDDHNCGESTFDQEVITDRTGEVEGYGKCYEYTACGKVKPASTELCRKARDAIYAPFHRR